MIAGEKLKDLFTYNRQFGKISIWEINLLKNEDTNIGKMNKNSFIYNTIVSYKMDGKRLFYNMFRLSLGIQKCKM